MILSKQKEPAALHLLLALVILFLTGSVCLYFLFLNIAEEVFTRPTLETRAVHSYRNLSECGTTRGAKCSKLESVNEPNGFMPSGRCADGNFILCSPARNLPAAGKCKELFSISEPFAGVSSYSEIEKVIKEMQNNRRKGLGGLTEPYKKISTYLPSLIVKNIRKIINSEDDSRISSTTENPEVFSINANMLKNQQKFSYKSVSRNRLQLGDGVLPHVPCKVKTSYTADDSSACLRQAVKVSGGRFHVAFLGDSKLRDLFLSLLLETKQLNYTIQAEDGAVMSVEEMLGALVTDRHLWSNKEASTTSLPGFNVSYLFEPFNIIQSATMRGRKNIQTLMQWVDGGSLPPDLLVVGYGQWMFYLMAVQKTTPITVLHTLDYLLQVDRLIAALLHKLSGRTRVLVLAQTRQRPHANTEYNFKHDVNNVGNTEWRESLLLARLGHLNEERRLRNYRTILRSGNSKGFKDIADLETRNILLEKSLKNVNEFVSYVTFSKFVPNVSQYLQLNSVQMNDTGSSKPAALTLVNRRHKRSPQGKSSSKFPKTNSKIVKQDSVWFWDSSLPLNLASIQDCETMYQHDPETSNFVIYMLRYKMRIRKYASYLGRLGVDPDKYLNPGAYHLKLTTPTTASPDLKPISSFNISEVHSSYARNSVTDTGNEQQILDTEYFDGFVGAYNSPELNCLDDLHAGTQTNDVEVTQLLNLICNRFMPIGSDYCCR